MVGTYDVITEMLGVILSLSVIWLCVFRRIVQRYPFVNLYLLASAVFSVGCLSIRSLYGYTSSEYFYFYYTGDVIFNLLGYLVIASLFDRMFRGSVFHPYVRPTLAIFFLLVVAISALFVLQNYSHLYSRFGIELQQNMFFVGVLLTFLLWISMSYLRAESRRFVLLVSGLGIYFSAHAANYALRFFFSASADPTITSILARVPPLAYVFMVTLWLYTFWRVPETEPVVEPSPGRSRVPSSANLAKVQIARE